MIEIHKNDSVRLVLFMLAILLAANALLGFVLTRQSQSTIKDLLQVRMLDVAKTAADMLDGDKLKKLTAEDKASPDYLHVKNTLGIFRDNIALDYIYCVQKKGEKEFVFSVDPAWVDPGEFGSPVVYTDALNQASMGKAGVDEEHFHHSLPHPAVHRHQTAAAQTAENDQRPLRSGP